MHLFQLAVTCLLTAAPSDAGVANPNKNQLVADAGGLAEKARAPLAPEVKALVDRVQTFYEKTADFVSGFRQDYTYKTFKRTQTSSGTVTFKKPGLMRWEYERPTPKTFVLAQDKVYAYDPRRSCSPARPLAPTRSRRQSRSCGGRASWPMSSRL